MNEYTGQNSRLCGQGFHHEGIELIDRGGFKLSSVIRPRSAQTNFHFEQKTLSKNVQIQSDNEDQMSKFYISAKEKFKNQGL